MEEQGAGRGRGRGEEEEEEEEEGSKASHSVDGIQKRYDLFLTPLRKV